MLSLKSTFWALGIVLTRLGDIILESDLKKKSMEMAEVPMIMTRAGIRISMITLFLLAYMSSLLLITEVNVSHAGSADFD
jgi:hypothetical protein